MKILDKKIQAISTPTGFFIKLGLLSDLFTRYLVFMDIDSKKIYIEEIYALRNLRNIFSTSLKLKKIEDDKEWNSVFEYITTKTNLLSEKRLKKVGIIINKTDLRGLSN